MNISVHKKTEVWKDFPGTCQTNAFRRLWRTYSDAVNGMLVERWWPEMHMEDALKTALWIWGSSPEKCPGLKAQLIWNKNEFVECQKLCL